MSWKMPAIQYMLESGTNKTFGRIRRQKTVPTFEQCVAVLEAAEAKGATHVYWFYTKDFGDSDATGYRAAKSIRRYECGEVVLDARACRTCALFASLFLDVEKRGSQVQYERCERAVNRLAQLLVELQAKAKGAA